jgi:metal-responsive CopG/Arc/MetJ family transcriptional regulator
MRIETHIFIGRKPVKTIQMTIDEPLLAKVDQVIQELNTSRSAFVRQALELALQQHKIAQMEKRHAEGYARHPVEAGEFDVWVAEQAWEEQ